MNSKVLSWTKPLEHMFGYTPEDVVGKMELRTFLPDFVKFSDYLKNGVSLNSPTTQNNTQKPKFFISKTGTSQAIAKDGRTFIAELTLRPERIKSDTTQDEPLFSVTIRDSKTIQTSPKGITSFATILSNMASKETLSPLKEIKRQNSFDELISKETNITLF
jgi:hypothetical protein